MMVMSGPYYKRQRVSYKRTIYNIQQHTEGSHSKFDFRHTICRLLQQCPSFVWNWESSGQKYVCIPHNIYLFSISLYCESTHTQRDSTTGITVSQSCTFEQYHEAWSSAGNHSCLTHSSLHLCRTYHQLSHHATRCHSNRLRSNQQTALYAGLRQSRDI